MAITAAGDALTASYKKQTEQRVETFYKLTEQITARLWGEPDMFIFWLRAIARELAKGVWSFQIDQLEDTVTYDEKFQKVEAPQLTEVVQYNLFRLAMESKNKNVPIREIYQKMMKDGNLEVPDATFNVRKSVLLSTIGEPEVDKYSPRAEQAMQMIEDSLADAAYASYKAATIKGVDQKTAVTRALQGASSTIIQKTSRDYLQQKSEMGLGPAGYARVPDSNPCGFCALLASRGVIHAAGGPKLMGLYRSDAFKNSRFKAGPGGTVAVHDGCTCTLEPVYDFGEGKYKLPPTALHYSKVWAEIGSGQGRDEGMKAFNRYIESGTLPWDYEGDLEGTRRKKPGDIDVDVSDKSALEEDPDSIKSLMKKKMKEVRQIEREIFELSLVASEDDQGLKLLKEKSQALQKEITELSKMK